MDDSSLLEEDLVHLARLGASESFDDIRLYVARLIRKYRTSRPELAARLDQGLKNAQTRSGTGRILRRDAVDERAARDAQEGAAATLPVDADTRLALIRVFDDRAGMPAPLLEPRLTAQLMSVVDERRSRTVLESHGIAPTKSAILVGPPGVGKTLSARWVASRLDKPLWVLDLSAVMSSLLGRSGNNLRTVLDHAKRNEAVLLLDEIDAIAKRRTDDSDVGELKRLVTVMLQELDRWPDTGLLLAATNHPELVDHALWRRFDVVLTFEMPDEERTEHAVRRFLGADVARFDPWVPVLGAALSTISFSDIERALVSIRRAAVLGSDTPEHLVVALVAQHTNALSKPQRMKLATDLARATKYSHHEISRMTGVARDTLRKHAGPSPRIGRGMK